MRLHGLIFLVLLLPLQACECECECEPTAPGNQGPYRIEGGDMGPMHQNLNIYQDGQPVGDAVVKVNGVAIPHKSSGFYRGELPDLVPVGSPLDLEVGVGGVTVRGTALVPETPGLSAPATGSSFASTDTITVRWTSTTTPERFMVIADWPVDGVHHGKSFPAPASARSLDIAASEFPPGAEVMLDVFAYNDGSFTGPAHPDSRMSIRGDDYSAHIVITIDP